jgi:hypothetical protein
MGAEMNRQVGGSLSLSREPEQSRRRSHIPNTPKGAAATR